MYTLHNNTSGIKLLVRKLDRIGYSHSVSQSVIQAASLLCLPKNYSAQRLMIACFSQVGLLKNEESRHTTASSHHPLYIIILPCLLPRPWWRWCIIFIFGIVYLFLVHSLQAFKCNPFWCKLVVLPQDRHHRHAPYHRLPTWVSKSEGNMSTPMMITWFICFMVVSTQ